MPDTSGGEPSTPPLRAAVLGSPIAHSKSPGLHRAAYAAAGLPWRYDAIEVTEHDLPDFLAALGPRWVGLSLTMPLKEAVLALVDDVDASARLTGAANTVVLPGSPRYRGRTVAYNTDVEGIVEAVRHAGIDSVESVAILGAGATARSAAAAAAALGAQELTVRARRAEAADDLASTARSMGLADVRAMRLDGDGELGAEDLTISTLPAGAGDLLATRVVTAPGALLDVVYAPWPTALAKAWNGTVIGGLEMLLWQAAAQVRLMAGVEPDIAAMRSAVGPSAP